MLPTSPSGRQPGHLDLLVFDGRVVSAYLPADDL
jgi:hypothetical protein